MEKSLSIRSWTAFSAASNFSDSDGNHEVTVGQTLHEGRSAETVSTVVGEVGLTDGIKAGNGGLEVIVDPDTSHGIVNGRINHHRLLPGRGGSDLLIHFEKIAVSLRNPLMSKALDSFGEVEEDGLAGLVHAIAGVATLLRGAGSHVTGNEVSEGRIPALEIVVAVLFGNLRRLDLVGADLLDILEFLGNPDAAVIAERLRHEGELALLLAVDGDTGRMDLREAGIGEECTPLIALKGCGAVGIHGVGGKEIGISISSGSDDNSVCTEALEPSGDEVAGDDTLGLTVYQHEVEHLVARITLDGTCSNLAVQGGICAEKQLLAGLAPCIEGTAHLDATEGAVGKVAAVLTGKRNSLCNALVDDGRADLGKTVDVCLAGAVISTFDGIIEKAVDGVVVILVILCGVDTTLGGDGVRAAGGVADAEYLDIVPEFTEGSGC